MLLNMVYVDGGTLQSTRYRMCKCIEKAWHQYAHCFVYYSQINNNNYFQQKRLLMTKSVELKVFQYNCIKFISDRPYILPSLVSVGNQTSGEVELR